LENASKFFDGEKLGCFERYKPILVTLLIIESAGQIPGLGVSRVVALGSY
jgi:hypothetical protein